MHAWGADPMKVYFEVGLLLGAVAFLASIAIVFCRARIWLKFVYSAVAAATVFPAILLLLPEKDFPRPLPQVWSEAVEAAPSLAAFSASVQHASSLSPSVNSFAFTILWAGLAISFLVWALHQSLLWSFVRRQTLIRSQGRLRIYATNSSGAFSCLLGRRAVVVIPFDFIEDRARFRMVLAHELQHHRQGDTLWSACFAFVTGLYFWNPAVYGLARQVARIQEFACDEALIGRRQFSPQAYSRCLLEAAKLALNTGRPPVGTTGMASSRSGHLLKRRIQMILNINAVPQRKGTFVPLLAVVLMAVCAVGAKSMVQERSLDRAHVEALVRASASEIPLELNDRVYEVLRKFTTTESGRKHFSQALDRLPIYRSLIERKAAEYGLPKELIVIPFYESGFKLNLVSSARSVGIWQFIPETARHYGLTAFDAWDKSNLAKEDRLDPEKETDAAMRYLKHLHGIKEFQGDWRLAIKAYNEGETHVLKQIKAHGTNDPWKLEAVAPREGYLTGAMAALILYQNPSLIR